MSHRGRAAEEDVVADGGKELNALLQPILQREDIFESVSEAEPQLTWALPAVTQGSYHRRVLHQGHVVTAQ